MLDLGFLPDVERLISDTPVNRQTMLFSATMPGPVIALARRYLRTPTNIRAESTADTTVPLTKQHVFRAHQLDKIECLARILQATDRRLVMVFAPTRRLCQNIADGLTERGFAAAAVHGDLGQGAREQAVRAFRSGKVDVLVATDVAARGIDIDDVTHVVNYDCPDDEKSYLHRIGRTGRAGRTGVAVTFVDWADLTRWQLIDKALGLGLGDPAETYSTSPHFYAALDIPAEVKGTLPKAARTRAGLGAEHVEDLGETGRNRSKSASRAGSGNPTASRAGSNPAASRAGSGNPAGSRSGSSNPPAPRTGGSSKEARGPGERSRSRSRTRSGRPIDSDAPKDAGANGSAPNAAAAAPGFEANRRRRSRTRGSASAGETATVTD
jgi:superfamily II DNA/RNA helicase